MATLKERYEQLRFRREAFLDRARECAALTIPSLLPPAGFASTQRLPQPYQGFGARGVVALASRLLVALLPTGQPFFSLEVPQELLLQQGILETPPDVEKGLLQAQNLIVSEIERRSWRKPTHQTMELLVATGNALERYMPDNSIRVYRLDQYVVVRDLSGKLVELIVQENVSPTSLPERARALLPERSFKDPHNNVELFTGAKRVKDGWRIVQELNGKVVPKSEGLVEELPFNPLRWSVVPGEDYGRGKVEEHLPDLRYLDHLSKSMIDGAALATRHVTMVRPNATGGNLRRRFAEANNGDVIVGNPEDVELKQFTNANGLQVAQVEVGRIVQELSSAFLLSSSMVRDAERVTATEVRMIAEELEGVLGGVYSHLSEDMMKARIRFLMGQMAAQGKLPEVVKMVEPVVTVGLEALEREKDVMRVQTVMQMVQAMPPEVLDYIDIPALLKTAMLGLNLPAHVRTEQEAAAIRQQRLAAEQGQVSPAA